MAGDLVADWSALAVRTVLDSERQPARAAHALAAVQLAAFEAMSFVEGGDHAPRLLVRPAAPLGGAGAVVAAASASYVLGELYPERKAAFDAALERSLTGVADSAARNARIWGPQVGAVVLATRGVDARLASAPAGSMRCVAALSEMVAAFLDAYGPRPIDRARIHARAAAAMSDAFSRGESDPPRLCRVVLVVLKRETG